MTGGRAEAPRLRRGHAEAARAPPERADAELTGSPRAEAAG
ncbi:hypothetical protein [Streptomyces sp. NPDC057429]